MTGKYEPYIAVEDVYQKLIECITDNTQASSGGEALQKFKYVDTPLVEANQFGYLIEIITCDTLISEKLFNCT